MGVDEENKQIACGLVDTIGQSLCYCHDALGIYPLTGSYTFAKTLEYKAKQGLNSGKEVTVIPPAEYQERFVNALERYFLPCPGASLSICTALEYCANRHLILDKWSQPMDGVKVSGDPNSLPSVL